MKKALAVLLAGVLGCSVCGCGTKDDNKEQEEPKEKMEEVVDFVIDVPQGRDAVVLQLTDIQIIDSSQKRTEGRLPAWSTEWWKPENVEVRAFNHMREIVNRVKPDLIVLSGDNVYGEFDDSGTMIQRLIAEMESYKIPWTLTFGNHDNETRKGVEWTCEQYASAEHCMFKRGPIDTVEGNGNFTVGIRQGGKITEVVWLMDSNGHTESDRDQNMFSKAGLYDGQIEWFTQTSERLKAANKGVSPKSIGFFHHPMRAIGDGMQKYGYVSAQNDFYTPDGDYGIFKPFVIPENEAGDSGSMILDCGYIDSDYAFHKLLKQYGCEGWFFGHVHENSTSVTHEGVRYTFGLKAARYDTWTNTNGREGGKVSLIGRDEVGGTKILLGEEGLRVQIEYCEEGTTL